MWKQPGMRTFTIIWAGQVVSLIGTAMTRFGVMVWAYEQTNQATTLALLGFFAFISAVLLGPVAGVWVDRWDKRKVLIISDLGAGMITIGLLLLYLLGELRIWHLYAAELLAGIFEIFQYNAYNVVVGVLTPKEQLARVNGMRSLGFYASRIAAPALAGLLLPLIKLDGILALDMLTFLFAISSLLLVTIPRPPVSAEGLEAKGNFWHEMSFGFRYIARHPGLSGLMVIFMGMNGCAALTYLGVMPAMLLARTGGNEHILASVQAVLGIGGVLGGLVVTFWGGFQRKIHGVLLMGALSFLGGDFLLAVGQAPIVWMAGGFVAAIFIPAIVSSNRAIWQAKVPADVQGRVLSAATTLQEFPVPFGFLLAGPLADKIFEPAMQPGGALAELLGGLVGLGDGAGMGAMFLGTATLGTLICLSGYLFPAIRNVEDDHNTQIVLPTGLLPEGAD